MTSEGLIVHAGELHRRFTSHGVSEKTWESSVWQVVKMCGVPMRPIVSTLAICWRTAWLQSSERATGWAHRLFMCVKYLTSMYRAPLAAIVQPVRMLDDKPHAPVSKAISRLCLPSGCIPNVQDKGVGSHCVAVSRPISEGRVYGGSTIDCSRVRRPSRVLGAQCGWRRGLAERLSPHARSDTDCRGVVDTAWIRSRGRPCIQTRRHARSQNPPSLMQPIHPVDSCIPARSTVVRAYDSCTLSKHC